MIAPLRRAARRGYRVAALPEICAPLLRLRPSRPRQGMVARRAATRRASRERSDLLVVADAHAGKRSARAADPRASAWVSANAGSGKTKVLTDRVLRLLLAGAPPGDPLPHLHQGGGRQHGDPRLRAARPLGHARRRRRSSPSSPELEGERPTPAQLRLARRLFARAVETPGGLKIETIHAFCERLLHLVPFEANVPARFAVLDEGQSGGTDRRGDRARARRRRRRRRRRSRRRARHGQPRGGRRRADASAIGCAIGERACRSTRRGGSTPRSAPARGARSRRRRDGGRRSSARMIEDGFRAGEWPAIAAALRRGKATDQDARRALRSQPRRRATTTSACGSTCRSSSRRRTSRAPRRPFVTKGVDRRR